MQERNLAGAVVDLDSPFTIEGNTNLGDVLSVLELHLAAQKGFSPDPKAAKLGHSILDELVKIELSDLGFHGSVVGIATAVTLEDEAGFQEPSVRTVTRTSKLVSSTLGEVCDLSYSMLIEVGRASEEINEVDRLTIDSNTGYSVAESTYAGESIKTVILPRQKEGYTTFVTLKFNNLEHVEMKIEKVIQRSSRKAYRATQTGVKNPYDGGAFGQNS